jgi:hypothetical protein
MKGPFELKIKIYNNFKKKKTRKLTSSHILVHEIDKHEKKIICNHESI